MSDKRIGEILVERGVIDAATAELIETERLLMRSRFLSAAVAHGRVSESDALAALASQEGIPAVDLARAVVDTSVVRKIPLEVARQHVMMAVRQDGNHLLVAMATPKDRKIVDELSFATGLTVLPHVALHARLIELIPKAHAATTPFFRGPLAPEEVAANQEYVPIVSDDRPPPDGLDIDIVVDADVELVEEAAEEGTPPGVAPSPEVAAIDEVVAGRSPARVGAGARAPAEHGAVTAEPTRPASGEAAAAHGDTAGGAVTPGGGPVLVIEDDPDIARLVARTVTSLGREAVVAGRGLEGLQLIKARRPSLLVLDAMLPEVHGFEICRKVKQSKRFGATPVLMISAIYRGWRIAEDIKSAYRVDAFLEKPFRVADLRHAIEQLLRSAAGGARGDEQLGARGLALAREGQALLARGEAATALDKLTEAESLEPFSAGVQLLLARALEKRERPFRAIYHYERAMELEPGLFAAARNAAVLYQSRGFKHKAREMWERALETAPTPEVREQVKQHLLSLL